MVKPNLTFFGNKAINYPLFIALAIVYILVKINTFFFIPDLLGISKVIEAKRDLFNLSASMLASIFGFFLAFVILGFEILRSKVGKNVSVYLQENRLLTTQITVITFTLIIILLEYMTSVNWDLSIVYFLLYLSVYILWSISEAAFYIFEDILSDKYITRQVEKIKKFGFNAKGDDMVIDPAFAKVMDMARLQIKNGNKDTAEAIINGMATKFWNQLDWVFSNTQRATHFHNIRERLEFMESFCWLPLIEECRQQNAYETINSIVVNHYRYLNRVIECNLDQLTVSAFTGKIKGLNQHIFSAGFTASADQQIRYIHEVYRTAYQNEELLKIEIDKITAPGYDGVTIYALNAELSYLVSSMVDTLNYKGDALQALSIIGKYDWSARPEYMEDIPKEIEHKIKFIISREATHMRKSTLNRLSHNDALEVTRIGNSMHIDLAQTNVHLLDHIKLLIDYNEFLAGKNLLSGFYHSPLQELYMAGTEFIKKIDQGEQPEILLRMIIKSFLRIKDLTPLLDVHTALLEMLFYYVYLLEELNNPTMHVIITDIRLAINQFPIESYKQYFIFKKKKELSFEMFVKAKRSENQ